METEEDSPFPVFLCPERRKDMFEEELDLEIDDVKAYSQEIEDAYRFDDFESESLPLSIREAAEEYSENLYL
jgi:bacterioferritin (cytochrome b1)